MFANRRATHIKALLHDGVGLWLAGRAAWSGTSSSGLRLGARRDSCNLNRLKRWAALTLFTTKGQLAVDNNWTENQIRPVVVERITGCSPGAFARVNERPR